MPTSTAQPTAGVIKGWLSYPTSRTRTDDAVLTIRVIRGSYVYPLPDRSKVLAEQRVSPVVPRVVPVELTYDPAALDPRSPYTILAEMSVGGKRAFTYTAGIFPGSLPQDLNIILNPVPTETAVRGIVHFPDDQPLPPDAVVTIRLETSMDTVVPWTVLKQQRVIPDGTAPLPFSIPIDPTSLDPYAPHLLYAYLEAPGGIYWTTQPESVLQPGALVLPSDEPGTVKLVLDPLRPTTLLTGLLTLPDSTLLPSNAVVTVHLAPMHEGKLDLAHGGRQIVAAGASPIRYAIDYYRETALTTDYALYASVRLHEKLLFTSPVIPLDKAVMPSTLDLSLQRPTNLGTVRGTVRYNADQPLPPDAKLVVHLADMRWVDEGSWPRRLATQTIRLTGAQPLSFAIDYDPLTITGDTRYAIIAEIRTDDEVLVPGALYNQDVITNGNPTEIDVVLK